MTRRRAVAYVLMAGVILKHLLLGEYGLFDRFLEIGVFLLIAYEVVHGIVSRRKARKREAEVKKRSDQVFLLMGKGLELMASAPSRWTVEHDLNKSRVEHLKWCESVKTWALETGKELKEFSALATGLFLDDSTVTSADPDVHPHVSRLHSLLSRRMANLRAIVDKPERYL
jgi:hypothetical protein